MIRSKQAKVRFCWYEQSKVARLILQTCCLANGGWRRVWWKPHSMPWVFRSSASEGVYRWITSPNSSQEDRKVVILIFREDFEMGTSWFLDQKIPGYGFWYVYPGPGGPWVFYRLFQLFLLSVLPSILTGLQGLLPHPSFCTPLSLLLKHSQLDFVCLMFIDTQSFGFGIL